MLDGELPGLTGLEVAGAFRATGKDTRFVLVSGLSRLKLDGAEPVHQFVRKPFDPDQFLTIVEEQAAHHDLTQPRPPTRLHSRRRAPPTPGGHLHPRGGGR